MRYCVTYNFYSKLDTWEDIKREFNSMAAAMEFIAKLEKMREWESITITAEK